MYLQCPECGSKDILVEGHRGNLRAQCARCGYWWSDDDEGENAHDPAEFGLSDDTDQ